MHQMKYINLLKSIFYVSVARAIIYKTHFFVEIAASLGWGAFSIITILLLTTRVSYVFGWTRNELILLAVMVNIIYGVLRVLFNVSFWRFSSIIHYGELDMLLLKPLDSQFQMSVSVIDIAGIFRFLISIALTICLIVFFHVPVSFLGIIITILLCIAGITVLYSLTFIFLTFTVWFSNLHNLIELVNTVLGASRYPKEMYEGLGSFTFFFLLPLVIIISTPTKALIGKVSILDSFLLVTFAIILFVVSRVFWKFALRYYSSASG